VDKAAFEQFIVQQQEPLRRFLLNLCAGNQAMADDIAQEAFIKCYLNLEAFQGRSKLSTWLFKIAYNCFYDYAKQEQRRRSELIDNYKFCLADTEKDDNAEELQVLYQALSKLKHQERVVSLLFYMEDKSLKEIATIVKTPVNTVKSHLRRAKLQLKKYLEEIGYERR
jgi:RNA polymerase sigma-70 factor (ECF subfamily)